MVTPEGVLKLLDFGIARRVDDPTMTHTGALVGTPAYMSPEQALGERVDARSDLFAAGIVLHEMYAGASPYAAAEIAVTLTRLMTTPVPALVEVAPWSSPGLQRVHAALTHHARDARCPDAHTARAILAGDVDVAASDPSLLARAVADPAGAREEGRRQTRAQVMTEVAALRSAGNVEGALLRLDALCRFAGDDGEAREQRDALARAHDYNFTADDDDLRALKRSVGPSTPPAIFRRLADRYRALRRLDEHARWLRRYVGAQPRDTLAIEQLGALDGATRRGGHLAAAADERHAVVLADTSPGHGKPALPAAPARANGPRELTAQPAPHGALRTRDVVAGVVPRAVARAAAASPGSPDASLPTTPARGPALPRRTALGAQDAGPLRDATADRGPAASVVLLAAGPDHDARGRGQGIALAIVLALVVGAGALFVAPALRGATAPPAATVTPRTPTGAALVDVSALLAEARVQWSNGDALAVVQTTTRVLSLAHETFVVDRREATCLRARAHARLRRTDEARADAQRCIDWQVAGASPEIEEMRRIVGGEVAF